MAKSKNYKDLEDWGDAIKTDIIVTDDEIGSSLKVGFDIDEEISEQAAQYGWYGVQEAQAQAEVDSYKLALEIYRAEKGKEIRADAIVAGRKVTEGSVNEELVVADEHKRLETKIINSKRNHAVISAMRKAYEHKLQMIITFCANERKRYTASENKENE